MSGCETALRPSTKNVALTHSRLSASSTLGVVPGQGPSSKVSTTSFGSRGSETGKCLRPTRGVVDASTASTRLVPSAPGAHSALAGGTDMRSSHRQMTEHPTTAQCAELVVPAPAAMRPRAGTHDHRSRNFARAPVMGPRVRGDDGAGFVTPDLGL